MSSSTFTYAEPLASIPKQRCTKSERRFRSVLSLTG